MEDAILIKKAFKQKRGQGIIEFTFTIIIAVVLLGGIINIWIWANNQIVNRQVHYNETRVIAGTSRDDYTLQWPVYAPDELEEGRVLLDYPK
jgi:hypothetical protein